MVQHDEFDDEVWVRLFYNPEGTRSMREGQNRCETIYEFDLSKWQRLTMHKYTNPKHNVPVVMIHQMLNAYILYR